ncbi:hypothetical protein FA13DRAFT_1765892 [Coprinellus micaceus]|uniref:DUF6593 domain-containing protein n=1 Tax=Coprinellus micaceus TaxID=71717 RepID=A0A4Y7STN9_COPMI|nr:hypothetical protein FA13DRAFT_1765892 [Coprinellus micaceus]
MHGTNPYAQAGWYNPQNPNTINTQSWGISAASGPSIFAPRHALPTVLTFHYVLPKPNVLNCTITGPTSIPYLDVTSDGARTIFRRPDGQGIACIEWSSNPTVEIISTVMKQPVGQWIRLSADRAHRSITINGKEFIWVFRDNCYCLFKFGELTKGPLVRIYQAQAITLELTTEAFHLGALEPSIVAVVLFQSGKL